MSNYTASVRVDGETLHTSRPLTAPIEVSDVIDSIEYSVRQGSRLVDVEVKFETADESDTPIADSVTGTSSAPLVPAEDDDGAEGAEGDAADLSAAPAIVLP